MQKIVRSLGERFAGAFFLDKPRAPEYPTEEARIEAMLGRINTLPTNALFPDSDYLYEVGINGKPVRNCLYTNRGLRTKLQMSQLQNPDIATVLDAIKSLATDLGHEEGAGPLKVRDARIKVSNPQELLRHWDKTPDDLAYRIVVKLFG